MNRVLGHLSVVTRLVIIAMHFDLPSRIKRLESRRDHENLLINFDFLNRLIVVVSLLRLCDRILNADRVLQLFSHFDHFWDVHVDEILLDRHEVFDKLFFGITLNVLNSMNFHGEKVALLVDVDVVFFYEEVGQNLKYVWLEQRNDQ